MTHSNQSRTWAGLWYHIETPHIYPKLPYTSSIFLQIKSLSLTDDATQPTDNATQPNLHGTRSYASETQHP